MATTESRRQQQWSALARLFYEDLSDLGHFEGVAADLVPPPYRSLLDHDEHMTVTVESFHGGPVDVEVLEEQLHDTHYARRILLRRASDGRVVQFGIVRLDFQFLDDAVRDEIRSRGTPLGRILIQHNVLREVELLGLWRIDPGPDLRELFDMKVDREARTVRVDTPDAGPCVFGRTALIHCNGQPAVELLEIVTPEA